MKQHDTETTKYKKTRSQLHTRQTLSLYWRMTWQHKRESLTCLALPAGNVLFSIVTPFFASHVLADMITHGPHLWTDFWWFTGAAVLGIVLNTVGIRTSMRLQAQIMHELHDLVFEHLLHRGVGFFNNQVGGKLVSDALDFVTSYGQLFNAGFITAGSYAAGLLLGLVLVFFSSWAVGVVITVLMAGLVYWSVMGARQRSNIRNQRLVLSKRLTAHLSDNIVNAVTVKTFANEKHELSANQALSAELANARKRDWQQSVTGENRRMSVLLLTQITLVLLLIHLTASDPQLVAAGIFAFTYTLTLVNRYFTIGTLTRQIEESFLQASPITELLQQSPEIIDVPDAKPLTVERGEITCTNVSFSYADAADEDDVFTGLNLHIKAGEKIGLIGHSGGGKSTLTKLLLRFDDVTGGSIAIDGQDIHEVTQVSLRKQISYVPQEPLLFHRTIRENIAYGNSSVTQQDVKEAARLAYAHTFITKLPKGYDTTVGERGVKLSGGQRQRIAIARAVLKNAPILVLDEATSALDSESEKAIQKALWELMKDKTAVVIAHRLSTIQRMDRIIVLDKGKIAEQGTHKELLKNKGVYAKLWAHQSGGFLEE